VADETTFRYLNLKGVWPALRLEGLVREPDGSLRLAAVPGGLDTVGPELAPAPGFTGPAGIGVDRDGSLFIAEPGANRIVRVDGCDGTWESVPCLGEGSLPGQLDLPRGVAVGPRGALYVVDSGNHRVQVVDLASWQVRGVWGTDDPYDPQPGSAPGRLADPWDIAADRSGALYVVDHGNGRVQKFDPDGRADASFAAAVAGGSVVPAEPLAVTMAQLPEGERVVVVDRGGLPPTDRILVFLPDGTLDQERTDAWTDLAVRRRDEATGATWTQLVLEIRGIAVSPDRLYLGDPLGGILVFGLDGGFVGSARGYTGVPAALVLDREGRILIHPEGDSPVLRLVPGAARLEEGSFVSPQISVRDVPTRWRRLVARVGTLVGGSRLRLFTYTSDRPDDPPGLDLVPLPSPNGSTPLDAWRPAPPDAVDMAILNRPGRYLWVGGVLLGDGTGSPALEQIQVHFERETWLRYLPPVYREDPESRAFLDQLLALLESVEGQESALIEGLPRLFDPHAAPDRPRPGSWLESLAGWVSVLLDERWDEPRRRTLVAEAFGLHALRGTPEGLRRLLELTLDAPVRITEPAAAAALWALGDDRSALGFTTMLIPAEAEGAVVGSTAIVDGSHLIDPEDAGEPLFEDLAHRFCVQAYASDLAKPGAADAVRASVEREKPAHTTYHLCLIGPHLRVGFQSRVGVDTIVAGPPGPMVLNGPGELAFDTALAGAGRSPASPATGSARIGSESRLT
jgi:phage tail-like protein